MSRFEFAFAPAYRLAALPLGITPRTAWVEITGTELRVRYGPWRLRTDLDNVASTQVSGGFAFHRTAGPPHLSLTDRGISFTPNGDRALCVLLHEPVPGIEPTGRVRHPGVTLGVHDIEGLRVAIEG